MQKTNILVVFTTTFPIELRWDKGRKGFLYSVHEWNI